MVRVRRPGREPVNYTLGPAARWLVVAMVGDRVVVDGTTYQVIARDWITPIPFVRGVELIVDLESVADAGAA
jgi:hypothetical protein